MTGTTERQQQILDFIQAQQRQHGIAPTLREIARHFGFRSMTAAADHVRALRRKGFIAYEPRQARAYRVISPMQQHRNPVVDVPVYGAVPAGFAADRTQEPSGCISLDERTLGSRSSSQLFALRVQGDSMIGKNILDGDYVVLEHGPTPRPGDVVAALIDNESTLKTFVIEKGKACLRAENPRYPYLIPANELAIQGVMVALVRAAQ